MLFNTIDFIIFFIVVFTLIVIIKNRKFQHLYLLFASFFFFYYSNNYLIILLIISIILDFYVGKEIWKTKKIINKKILLTLSIIGNLGLLGFYKYADFSISQFNDLGNSLGLAMDIPLLNLILPVGISFYTFQTLSYTIDIYRGRLEPSKSLGEFALFVAFFPQLVAGPILRASQFLPQLREKIENLKTNVKLRQVVIHSSNLKLGLTIMAFGFFKKMFFADNIRLFVDQIFQNPLGLDSFSVILGAIAFGVQIYCDFSGYSDIAIGLAMILGFKIPINFNKPYFATSPSDFWRKWHISLSTWLRDYLYIPLGGNKKSYGRIYLNVLIVMFLGGLWHGAAWNFVIWGMLHGTYLAIHKILINKFPNLRHNEFFKSKAGKCISIIITQYFVFLAWLVFRIQDLDGVLYSMYKYVVWDFATEQVIQLISLNKFPVILIIIFFIFNFISYKHGYLQKAISKIKLRYWFLFLGSVLMLILIFQTGPAQDFIYFRF
jgi:D-alanyl-lipoteichoic acid acyltransferase DltB (MBOAT superfamily)